MDIEKIVKVEAPENTPHDQAYAKALREVYARYKNLNEEELTLILERNRLLYRERGSTHHIVAGCMIAYKLLEERGVA